MKRVLFISFCIFLLFNSIYSQGFQFLLFEETQHNFGVVKEETEKITYTFNFKNVSKEAVLISNVATSCGCTAGEWKKTPIAPGEEDKIVVSYKTARRPGKFTQHLVIHLNNNDSNNIVLYITGEVLPREKTKYDIYPIPLGNLRFITTHLAFDTIYNDETSYDTLFIYNDWDKPMSVELKDYPVFLSYEAIPKVLKPKEDGKVIIKYDAAKRKDFGLIYDRLTLFTNDSMQKFKTFQISAEIVENFSRLNLDNLKKAPNMIFENETYNFDTITEGEIVKKVYNFSNTGISDLIIRKISTSCGCTASQISSEIIKSSDQGGITVEFNSTNKKGYQRQTITVITNNPHRPTIKLVLHGYVKSKL